MRGLALVAQLFTCVRVLAIVQGTQWRHAVNYQTRRHDYLRIVVLDDELVRGAMLCLLLYRHVNKLPTLGSGNFEDSDHNAEM